MTTREYVLALAIPATVLIWLAACIAFQNQITGFVVQHTTPWADEEMAESINEYAAERLRR